MTTDRAKRYAANRLLADALYDAIQWRESLAEAWPAGTPERAAALAKAAEYRKALNVRGYREPSLGGQMVSILDLKRGAA